jgi:2-methylcitrate dehydratase PrpD
MTLTSDLGNHFSKLQFAQIPAEKKTDIKRLLLDYLGVALAGSRTDTGRIASEFAIELGGTAQATLIGRGNKVPAVHAAFANAISSHSIELDDIDDEALFHYSPPVYSAGLAAAEMVGANGAEFLTAVFAGCEMMNRLSRATNPSLRNRGFHTTPTCGVFGGTVAAGKMLKLSPEQMTSALGLAGAQASGLMEMYGTSMQKRINPGPAARNAVTAASLAKKGFTGADTIIEGKRGFAAAFSDHFDPSKLTEGLGLEFPVVIEFKPYSCARPIHNAIDCALNVRGQNSFKLDKISEITFYRHPAWAEYHVITRPRTYHEAQVSLPYSAAVALVEGAALLPQYSEEKLKDVRIMSLAEKVTVVKDPSLPRGVSCRMVVKTLDGQTYTSQVDYPKGSVQNPMTDTELAAKFCTLASTRLKHEQIDQVIQMASEIEKFESIATLMKLVS